MENEIKRGDYVILKPYADRSKNPIVDKLYDDNYGRNGLVRNVTYAPSQPWKVAEVIFSGVPYISVVPIIYLDFIRKREEWPLRTRCFPEPDMTAFSKSTCRRKLRRSNNEGKEDNRTKHPISYCNTVSHKALHGEGAQRRHLYCVFIFAERYPNDCLQASYAKATIRYDVRLRYEGIYNGCR